MLSPSVHALLYIPLHLPVTVPVHCTSPYTCPRAHPSPHPHTPSVSGVSEACHQLVVMTLLMAVFCTRHGDTPCRVALRGVQEDLNLLLLTL